MSEPVDEWRSAEYATVIELITRRHTDPSGAMLRERIRELDGMEEHLVVFALTVTCERLLRLALAGTGIDIEIGIRALAADWAKLINC